jgi:hypothetical protein
MIFSVVAVALNRVPFDGGHTHPIAGYKLIAQPNAQKEI